MTLPVSGCFVECDNCGRPIELELHGEPAVGQEFAVTCDCGKTIWFTVTKTFGTVTGA